MHFQYILAGLTSILTVERNCAVMKLNEVDKIYIKRRPHYKLDHTFHFPSRCAREFIAKYFIYIVTDSLINVSYYD